ncbi:hypothetical protein [Pseudomonas saponiphila]|uniref:hypothetical protein n=1 Tax=Pseudomonas saponiphila TaxID=556534 RepID=UPI001428AFE1|nr:hypothetical protein [Pseudomonas saponiphila]
MKRPEEKRIFRPVRRAGKSLLTIAGNFFKSTNRSIKNPEVGKAWALSIHPQAFQYPA